jgi:hypothetical protein
VYFLRRPAPTTPMLLEKKLNKSFDPKSYTIGEEIIFSEADNLIAFALDVVCSMSE